MEGRALESLIKQIEYARILNSRNIDGNVMGKITVAGPVYTFEFQIHSAEKTSTYFIQGSILRYVSLQKFTITMQVLLATAEGKSTKDHTIFNPIFCGRSTQ